MATNSPEDTVSIRALEMDGWRFAGWLIYKQTKRFVKERDVIIYDKKTRKIIGRYQLVKENARRG